MIQSVMDEITKAEAQADEIIASANAKTKEIAASAEKQRAAIVLANKQAAAKLKESLEGEAIAVAKGAADAVLSDGANRVAALADGVAHKVDAAAEEVAKQLLTKYGITSI